MNAKQLKKIHIWIRAIIQLLYFIFIPSVYTAAFAGVKYIFTQIGAGEKVALTSFVTVLIVVCVYTAVFGRFFCGFACAFGSLGDGVNALYRLICKKMKKKPVQIPDRIADRLVYLKYVILVIIVFMCYGGVYSKAQGTSPWDVFSMIHAGNFKLNGYLIGLVILVFLIVGMCLEERFLPDGSCILTGSGVAGICTSQRPGILHSKVQCMFQKMSGEYRTSDGWFLESRR